MNREFLINIFLLIGINLVIKPFYIFGVDLKVQNEIDNYGLYFALVNFSYIFQIFTDLGIHQYNSRNVAQNDYLFEKYFPHILLIKGGLSLFFLILSFSVAFVIGYQIEEMHLLGFLLFNQIFITFTFFFRSNIAGLQHYRLDSLLSILDKLLMLIICLPLLWGPWLQFFTLEKFIYAQTVSFGLTTLIAFFLTSKYLTSKLRFRLNFPLFVAILKKSIPYALVVLLMSIYTRVDVVMIERLLFDPVSKAGINQANIYAAAYRLLDAVNMVCFLFAGLLLPMFARMIKNKEKVNDLLHLSAHIMMVITVSFSISFCFNAQEIMMFLYNNYSPSMTEVAVLLMVGFNAIGGIYIMGTLLTANGNLRQMNIVFSIGILINIFSNYFMILSFGAWGAAVCTLCTQSFVALTELELVRRNFKIEIKFWYVGRIILFVLGVYAINYGLEQIKILWLIRFILAGIFCVIWAFCSKMLEFQRVLSLIRPITT
ncbi:MAG: oligosaccharide flippase family protein [Saprospiraceae bacterium]|nr:oligosaccharide flippase family protein [Saprospiraceae bacterium]